MKILALFTQVDAVGGVQQVGRQTAVGIQRFATATTLSVHDDSDTLVRSGESTTIVRGSSGSKLRFVRSAIVASRGADLVLVGHPNLAGLIPLLRGRRTAVLAYGIDGWHPHHWTTRRGMRKADAVGAISNYTLERMLEVQHLAPRSTFVLHLGLDPVRLPQGQDRTPSSSPTILSISRLDSRDTYKGIDDTIEALPAILAEAPSVRYRIVGDGDDRPRLEHFAASVGVTASVDFLGACSDQTIAEELSGAHVFALPSSEEGFGLVFLEAMAWRIPIVASTQGAAPEIVHEGKTGLLVGKNNPGELAAAVLRLLTDQTLARDLATAGVEEVNSDFMLEDFERRLEAICRGIHAGQEGPVG